MEGKLIVLIWMFVIQRIRILLSINILLLQNLEICMSIQLTQMMTLIKYMEGIPTILLSNGDLFSMSQQEEQFLLM